jgi:hypothetical protein
MKVLGHDHVSENDESIALANFFQNGRNRSRRQAEPSHGWR